MAGSVHGGANWESKGKLKLTPDNGWSLSPGSNGNGLRNAAQAPRGKGPATVERVCLGRPPFGRPTAGSSLPPPVAHIGNPPAILFLCHTFCAPAAHVSTREKTHSPTRRKRSIFVQAHIRISTYFAPHCCSAARTFRARVKVISPASSKQPPMQLATQSQPR